MKNRVSIAIALLSTLVMASCAPNYSDGDRIGVVTKLSYKGVLLKSWEGEMLVALPPGMMGSQPESFEFNVDPSAVEKVKAAMAAGKRVRLVYRQWLVAPWTITNDHVIMDVQEVK